MGNNNPDVYDEIFAIGTSILSYCNQRDMDIANHGYDIEIRKQERKREKQELKAKIKALKIQKELKEAELQYLTTLTKCIEAETLKYYEVIQQISVANSNYFQRRLEEITEDIFSTKSEMLATKSQDIFCLKVNEINELRKERKSIDDKFLEIQNNLIKKMQFAKIDGLTRTLEEKDDEVVEDAEWEIKNEEENIND